MTEKELDSLLKNVDSLIEEYDSKKNELDKEIEAKTCIEKDIKRYETLSVSISSKTYDALIKHIETIDNNIVSINARLKEIKDIITNMPNAQEAAIIKQLSSIITNKTFNYTDIKNDFYILNKIETFISTHAKKIKEHDLTEKE